MPIAFSMDLPFFTKFERAFKVSGCFQLAVLLLASLVLDEGEFLQWMLLAETAYWIAVVIIMIRRNGSATRNDQFLLEWGFPVAIVLAACLLAVLPIGLLRHR